MLDELEKKFLKILELKIRKSNVLFARRVFYVQEFLVHSRFTSGKFKNQKIPLFW